jgi:hypothetical protein
MFRVSSVCRFAIFLLWFSYRFVASAQTSQAITFPPLDSRHLGEPSFDMLATSTSGLKVSYSSSDPSVAEVNGSVLILKTIGTAIITATQSGDSNFEPAQPVEQGITVLERDYASTLAKLVKDINTG